MAVVLLIGLSTMLLLGRMAAAATERAAAQSAADAVVLAAANQGSEAARLVARANAVELIRLSSVGDIVQAEIRRGAHTAVATAERYEE
jgi:hypothetical protein